MSGISLNLFLSMQSLAIAATVLSFLLRFFVQKGKTVFGYYKSMTEAYYYKKKLMDNNWDMNALKTMISLRIDINKKLDLNKEYSVKLNYCPKCRRKLKNKEKECPYCGIDIKDYLYNN